MGLKAKLKSAIIELTPIQKAALVFTASVLPPVVTFLEQVGTGAVEPNVQGLALLGSVVLGGVLAGVVKLLAD